MREFIIDTTLIFAIIIIVYAILIGISEIQ
jgi:hypothetical protein